MKSMRDPSQVSEDEFSDEEYHHSTASGPDVTDGLRISEFAHFRAKSIYKNQHCVHCNPCVHKIFVFSILYSVILFGGSVAGTGFPCHQDPCQHGVCVDHLNKTYSCFCEDGFTGYECQTNWDECWSQPCLNGATCVDRIAAFQCLCPPGFTGPTCGSEINECLSNPCRNGGTCQDFLDKYNCTCPSGYVGLNCEVDISVCNGTNIDFQPKCLNGGECIEGPGLHFTCICRSGWRGKTCADDNNECLDSPCYNGGVCINYVGSFGCACLHGYTGHLCEEEVIQCKQNPCKNGAYCIMENENATCYCVPDYHGHLCQHRYNDCLPNAPRCRNSGRCIDGVDSFQCACPQGVSGVLCHCTPTDEGEICEELPRWYKEKPFHPVRPIGPTVVPEVTDAFPKTYYFSELFPPSVTTTFTEIYETPVLEISPSPSAKLDTSVIPDFLITIFPTSTTEMLPETTEIFFEIPEESITAFPTTALEPTPTAEVSVLVTIIESTFTTATTDTLFTVVPPKVVSTPTLPTVITETEYPGTTMEAETFRPTTGKSTTELKPEETTTLEHVPSPEEVTTKVVPDVTSEPFITTESPTPTYGPTLTEEVISNITTMFPLDLNFTSTTEQLINVTATTSLPFDVNITYAAAPATTTESSTPSIFFVTESPTESTTERAVIFETTQLPEIETETPVIVETITYETTALSTVTQTGVEIEVTNVTSTAVAVTTLEVFTEETKEPGIFTTTEALPSTSREPIPVTYPPEFDSTTSMMPEITTPEFTIRPISPTTTEPSVITNVTEIMVTTTEFPAATYPVRNCLHIPCYNGGTCVIIGPENAVCRCPFNYIGGFCETFRYVSRPHFSGSSYLKLKSGDLFLRDGIEVYMQFNSEAANGLVIYSEGNSNAFFILMLRNSLLQLGFSCGLQTVSFLQGNEKFPSNWKTDVLLRLWWDPVSHVMPWGKGRCGASMQVNESDPIFSDQEAASSDIKFDSLYLGGLPSGYSSPLVVKAGFIPRLRGCITLLEINELEVDPWLSGIEGQNIEECGFALCPQRACFNGGTCITGTAEWSCRCSDGYEGEFCERRSCVTNLCFKGICLPSRTGNQDIPFCLCKADVTGPSCNLPLATERSTRLSYSGTYDGYSSYSSHSIKFDHRRNFVLRFHFTTKYLDQIGMLLFLGRRITSAKNDFFVLALVRGYLMLTWDLGSGPRRIFSKNPLDPSWHTHSVIVGKFGKWGWMDLDTQGNVSAKAPGYLSSLETNDILYFGGHPSWNFSYLPGDLGKLQGFKGCIFDVRMSNSLDGPWVNPYFLASLGVGHCERDACQGHLCQNGAVCQPVYATYRCRCSPGWKGSFCNIPSHSCKANSGFSCSIGSSCIDGAKAEPPKCLCPYGKSGTACEKELAVSDPLFATDHSYLSINGGHLLRTYSSVFLEFKSLSTEGILLFAVPSTPEGDFLSVAILNRTVFVTFRLGNSALSTMTLVSTIPVALDKWQTMSFLRRGSEGTLRFGGEIVISSPTRRIVIDDLGLNHKSFLTAHFLDVQLEIFLGGIPDSSLIPQEMRHLQNIKNFHGCIRKLRIGDQKYNLDVKDPHSGIIRGQGIEDCDGTSCGSEVCSNGGTCTSEAANHSFQCSCTEDFIGMNCETSAVCVQHMCQNGGLCEPIYVKRKKRNGPIGSYYCLCPPHKTGTYCEKDGVVQSAQFRNKSYAIVTQGPFLGTADHHKDVISLNFSSRNPHNLIFWRGHINNPENDYLGLGIYRGRIKFVWHLGGENIGEISPQDFISDGTWHSIAISRFGKVVTMFLDGATQKASSSGDYTQLNAPNMFYIGGFPENNYLKYSVHLHFQNNYYEGCLRDVRLHPGSNPIVFSQLKEGRDLQKCFGR